MTAHRSSAADIGHAARLAIAQLPWRFCLFLAFVFPAALRADTYTVPGTNITLTYSVGGTPSTATITDCNRDASGTLVIPSSLAGLPVSAIGDYAFSDCDSLTSITIPSGVTLIGEFAFSECSVLASITIPSGVTSISNFTFIGCFNLISVEIPSSVTSIGYGAFLFCDSLASVTIPSGVTFIGNNAFQGCRELASITIPAGLTTISDAAFAGCSKLTTVDIPSGVTSIGNSAFSDCFSLSSVTIPSGVTSIGDYAFRQCDDLITVTIPLGVTSIGDYAFYKCADLTTVTLPSSITTIGDHAFSGCHSLASATIPSGVTSIGDSTFLNCYSLTSATIPTGVTSIGVSAFAGCSSLTSVTIPGGVTFIGVSAFAGCSSLTSVTIPSGVTFIGDRAFSGCAAITSVTIPRGVTSVRDYTFLGCSGLTSVTILSGVTSIGNAVFAGCASLARVTIPSSIKFIGESAFAGCAKITTVTIPSGVRSIGAYTFSECSALTNVTIPSSVTSIGEYAFAECDSLTGIKIPSSVTSIDRGVFIRCASLTSVTIPPGVTSIGDAVFAGCTSLTSVTLPSGVTSIGNSAFGGCALLAGITIPPSVTYIGFNAFSQCTSLTSMTIPPSVTSIGDSAFSRCTSLTTVTIPSSVSSIGYYAFSQCDNLTSVTFFGDAPALYPSVFYNSPVTIRYGNWATGFTSPSWLGYPAQAFEGRAQTLTFAALPNRVAGSTFTLAGTAKSGMPVTFAVVSGPATLGADGKTVAVGSTAGTVLIRATQVGGILKGVVFAPAFVERAFDVTLGPPTVSQTISFTQPTPTTTYGAPGMTLAATASSGLPVSFEVISGPASLGTDGRTLNLTGAGKVVVRAAQPGDATYRAATPITRTLVVNKKPLTVRIAPRFPLSRVVGRINILPSAADLRYDGLVPTDAADTLGNPKPGVITEAPVVTTAADTSSPGAAHPGLAYPLGLTGGLAANYTFVAGSPFGPLQIVGFGGTYEALVTDGGDAPLGKLVLTLPANGLTYTGSLALAAEAEPIVLLGTLSPSDDLTSATHIFGRPKVGTKPDLAMSFTCTSTGLSGFVLRSGVKLGDLTRSARLGVPAAPLGTAAYTLVLGGQEGALAPGGAGYATGTLAAKGGLLKFTGKLGDGTAFTASLSPASDRSYRVWVNPYNKRIDSYLAGQLTLRTHPATARFPGLYTVPAEEGTLWWAKGASPDKPQDSTYRSGFGPLELSATLDPWLPPSAKAIPLNGVSVPAGTLAQRLGLADSSAVLGLDHSPIDGTAAASLPEAASLIGTKITAAAPNPTGWKITALSAATGAFSGSFTLKDAPPAGAAPVTRIIPFSGVLRQRPDLGAAEDALLGAAQFLFAPAGSAGNAEKTAGEIQFIAP